jgi:urease accessory protein UreE
MLLDRVIGNVAPGAPGPSPPARRDTLELTWRQCFRRAVRGRTAGGVEVGVLLPPGVVLRHGDVLAGGEAPASEVMINVISCDVWAAVFADASSLAAAALELGNLHAPVEVSGDKLLVTVPDGPVRAVLDKYALSWRPDVRRFHPLRATVNAAALRLDPSFRLVPGPPQLTNSRE